MHQPRINLGKAMSKGRSRRQTRSPETATTNTTTSPLDALVRGLVAIGERFFKGPAQFRVP
jgi:hypothetical protein